MHPTNGRANRQQGLSLRRGALLAVAGALAGALLAPQWAAAGVIGFDASSGIESNGTSGPQATLAQQVDFSFSGSTPLTDAAWIEPWNPALGVSLDEVRIRLTGQFTAAALTAPGADHTATIQLNALGPDGDGFSFDLSPGTFTFDQGAHTGTEPATTWFTSDFDLVFHFDHISDITGLSFPTFADGDAFDPPVVALGWRDGFIGNPGNDIEQLFTFEQLAGDSSVSDITGQGQLEISYIYTVPEPGTAALLAVASFVLLTRPRSASRPTLGA